MKTVKFWILSISVSIGAAQANDRIAGDTTSYSSPNGVQERCVSLSAMPGGNYGDEDKKQEKALCSINFYDSNIAICPKLRSTSPGTFVYRLGTGPYEGNQQSFEQEVCPRGQIMVKEADGNPVSFKVTMNDRTTSGTFSTASLLYYHFSRYLDANIHVPVAVWRSMDRTTHEQRVTRKGLEHSAGKKSLKMNHAAWQILDQAEKDPGAYRDTDELFTTDRSQIYGVMLNVRGKRYGPEFMGTRKSGWGDGQNRDFQQTAPFLALRSDKPLADAIAEGRAKASEDPDLRKAMGNGISNEQLVYWMQDVTEITLLDYIFTQQDRIGNVDYVSYWYWVDGDEVKFAENKPDSVTDAEKAKRIRRTWLNDNDAGGKARYANFTRRTQMLEKLRHYNPKTYRLLMAMDRDFSEQGKLFEHVRDTFGLTASQFENTVKALQDAAAIIRSNCEAGKLRFDLDPDAYFKSGNSPEHEVSCNG